MLTDWNKTYEAVMLLGQTTDTQDTSGNVIRMCEPETDARKIMDAIDSFVGDYEQIPPMYSALKHNGRKLYELARQGIEVERKPRHVRIESIRVNELNVQEHTVRMTVECSKGTYIRTLCNDIGDRLGCGACMKELTRTSVGCFNTDNALTLGSVQAKVLLGDIADNIIPIDAIFNKYRAIHGCERADAALHNGNMIPVAEEYIAVEGEAAAHDDESFRMYDSCGIFVGIYRHAEGRLVPVKMFYDAGEAAGDN